MKKKLLLLLFSAVLSLGFVVPVGAAPDVPGMLSYDFEPDNNNADTAPMMNLDVGSGGTLYKGYLHDTMDGDYYRIKTSGDLMVNITFWPPDTQQYYLAIFEKTSDGQLIGVTSKFYNSGLPEPTEFRPKANTEYAIFVTGWNITNNPSSPYNIGFSQYQ